MIACDKKPMNITCKNCGAEHNIMINPEDMIRWESGEYIQDVMAYLSSAEREMLISQTCDDCWKSMYAGWPEAEEDDDE